MKIKVCFVSIYAYHYFNPESKSRFGGAEYQLYLLAKKLASDPEFEVSFVVGDFGHNIGDVDNIHLYKFFDPRPKWKYFRAIKAFINLWNNLRKINGDVYIQSSANFETVVVSLFARFKRRKFIYLIAHDDEVKLEKPEWMAPNGIVGEIRWKLFKNALRNSDLVLAQHEEQRHDLERNYKKGSKVRLYAHKITKPEINIDQKKYILWVARGEKWKQPEIFLKLSEKFPNEKFVMVMPATNDLEYFNHIKSAASKLKNLEFIDMVPFDKIDEYFLHAKIFVNTSRSEGFPNTFIQAALARTSILSLNINPNQMLEKFQMGFWANGNTDKLSNFLTQIVNDNNQLQKIGDQAYNYVKTHHDLDVITENDKQLIKSLF